MAEARTTGAQSFLSQLKKIDRSSLVLSGGVIFILFLLIMPLNAIILDLLIAINLASTLLILLTVTNIRRASEFTVFPTLILLTTVFRIALNVSSTKLILSEGRNFDGKIITAFGEYVVGSNYVVGLVIFMILVALQFIVIVKGATRISEVAARFTLEGMPTKLMTVDTEMAQGRITPEEAEIKRKEIRSEADFFGSMDGASKFVSGDVKLGFLITLINIIGGMFIGMSQGMDISNSAKLFLKLSVGDGLVSQIPSILISLSTGIIVARADSDNPLGKDIKLQLIHDPKSFFVAGAFLFLLAWLPGLPTITLILLSLSTGYLGYFLMRNAKRKEDDEKRRELIEQEASTKGPEDVTKIAVNIDPIGLEIGYNLIPLVDSTSEHGNLLERIKIIRRSCAVDLGLIVPPIRIQDNLKLKSNDYVIKIKGVEEARGSVKPSKLLAIPKKGMQDTIEGEPTLDPTFGEPAKWIDREKMEDAEAMGYTVVDASTVISSHITDIIKKNADTLIGRKEVNEILDSIRERNNTIVDEIRQLDKNSFATVQKVLKNLLREQISIRNMVTILEAVSDNIDNREVVSVDAYGNRDINVDRLTEFVRQRLAKQICLEYADDNNVLHVFPLDLTLAQFIEATIQNMGTYLSTTISDNDAIRITQEIFQSAAPYIDDGVLPVVVCDMNIRPVVRAMIVHFKSRYKEYDKPKFNLNVLSYSEIVPNVEIQSLGVIEVSGLTVAKEEVVDDYGY